jgi:hypothetical protein
MNHNDQVIEEADVTRNVEFWIDDESTGDAANLDVDKAALVLASAGVVFQGLPRQLAFDGQYQVNVARDWWDAVLRSGNDYESQFNEYLVHMALI